MNPNIKKEIVKLLEESTNYLYPIRWVDEKTTLGDFDGREFAIDVFKIPIDKQIEFLAMIRPVRNKIKELTGHRCIFIFHSPESTQKYYAHLFPVTKGIQINKGLIKIPLPDIGGTEGKPEIINPYLKLGKAA